MRWACARCGGAAGEKTYASAEDAARYAAAFDDEDRERLKRRPLPGLVIPEKLLRDRKD